MFTNIASSPRGRPAWEAEKHINNTSNIYKAAALKNFHCHWFLSLLAIDRYPYPYLIDGEIDGQRG